MEVGLSLGCQKSLKAFAFEAEDHVEYAGRINLK